MFGFFKKREDPQRKILREQFEKVVSKLRSTDQFEQAAVGHAINLANTVFIQRFASVAAFKALPDDEKMPYIKSLSEVEKKFVEQGDLQSALGFSLFGDWAAMVASGDEALARQFKDAMADMSRLGDAFFGGIGFSPNQEPRPAGYEQMTEEQRTLSARFIREHKERAAAAEATPARPRSAPGANKLE